MTLRGSLLKNNQQKKVAVIGWLGAFNLGDEMMLDTSLAEFRRHGHDITLLTHSDDEKVHDRYQGYKVVSRTVLSDEKVRFIATHNDALFVNGGALLDDSEYEQPWSLAKDIARLAKAFIRRKKKVLFYGISTNDIVTDPAFIRDFTYILKNATYVSVRDIFSQAVLAKELGCTTAELVDDIVFADPAVLKEIPEKQQGRIAIIPLYNNETEESVYKLVTTLTEATNQPMRFIHFFDEHDHDARATEKMRSRLGEGRFAIDEVYAPRNAEELQRSLEGVDVVFSARYHGILFASAVGNRVVSLHYNTHRHYQNKNTYLWQAYGYGEATINISEITSLSVDKIRNIISSTKKPNTRTRAIHRRAKRTLTRVIKGI